MASTWFRSPGSDTSGRCHLFLFPFAGGDGDSLFSLWTRNLPPSVFKVHTLTLPGRGRLRKLPLETSMPTVAAHCALEIRRVVDSTPLPVAFYGASLGCLIAYETAKILFAEDGKLKKAGKHHFTPAAPIHLFVAGHVPPAEFASKERKRRSGDRISALPYESFKKALLRWNLVDKALLEDEDFAKFFVPIVRADLVLDESYRYEDSKADVLPCPITTFCAADDRAAPPGRVELWSAHTKMGKVEKSIVFANLGHEFLLEKNDLLCEEVSRALLTGPLMRPWPLLLVKRAMEFPDKPAVTFHTGPGDKTLTLGAFCHQAWILANSLRNAGVRRHSNVLLVLPSCYMGILGLFAANICGARGVPTNPKSLLKDIKKRIFDLKPPVIIFQDAKYERDLPTWAREAKESGILVLSREEVWRMVDEKEVKGRYGDGEGQIICEDIDLDDYTFVAYTSGSTGLPKGMPLTHRNVANNTNWRCHVLPMVESDVFALSIFWWWYWHVPLLQGARVTLVDPVALIDIESLCNVVQERKITQMDLTPSLLGEALSIMGGYEALKGLRRVVCYGEPLSLEVCKLFHRCLKSTALVNLYSTTENNDLSYCIVTPDLVEMTIKYGHKRHLRNAPVGIPLWNVALHKVPIQRSEDDNDTEGEKFEFYAHDIALPPGYINRPEENKKAYVTINNKKMYRCGDLVTMCHGHIVVIGRADQVVNVRGYRVGLEEVNSVLASAPNIREGLAVFYKKTNTLVAFMVLNCSYTPEAKKAVRAYLSSRLDSPAVPSRFFAMKRLPKNRRGKLDKRTLIQFLEKGIPEEFQTGGSDSKRTNTPERKIVAVPLSTAAPSTKAKRNRVFGPSLPLAEMWKGVVEIWRQVLGAEAQQTIGAHDDFFEIGGHSLLAIKLAKALGLSVAKIMVHRTPQSQAKLLEQKQAIARPTEEDGWLTFAGRKPMLSGALLAIKDPRSMPIAIIGMAGRWPGAETPDEFWGILQKSTDSFVDLSSTEMTSAGVPRELFERKEFVRRAACVPPKCVEFFEPEFFSMGKGEAKLTDPNQRVLLEVSYEALESAGYDPTTVGSNEAGGVGCFMAGPSFPTYLINVIKKDLSRVMLYEPGEYVRLELGNDKDYIAPRVSFCLGLNGPSRTVQSACSSSLVCVVEAVQALRRGDCGMAIAGGISIQCPQKSGYLYQEGMVLSPDGRVRPFDSAARGTIFTNGSAVVTLKPLARAIDDGDNIMGVIRGCADNNDGRREKKFFAAPSAVAQSEVVARALRDAHVRPSQITYMEAHGTGTLVGDPIEFQGLCRVYNADPTTKRQGCAIGSIKGHIGHPNTAAGVCALSKVLLMLKNRMLPPIANYNAPNPAINFKTSPFYPCDKISKWPKPPLGGPRLAGLSAFGMGGTNAHVVLEEFELSSSEAKLNVKQPYRPWLIMVSGRTHRSFLQNLQRLSTALSKEDMPMGSVSRTLLCGRRQCSEFRWTGAFTSCKEAAKALDSAAHSAQTTIPSSHGGQDSVPSIKIVYLFSGQGSQYLGMASGLYNMFPRFKSAVDECSATLGYNPLSLPDSKSPPITSSRWAQVAVFVVSYATSQLLESLGVRPSAAVGHSAGEYACAVACGVMELHDALRMVDRRGKLMDEMEEGGMLAVFASAQDAEIWLKEPGTPDRIELACNNAPDRVVLSGPKPALEKFAARVVKSHGARAFLLPTAKAFHSKSVTKDLQDYLRALLSRAKLKEPRVPMLCNLTGGWLDGKEATSPDRWAAQMRGAVQFRQNIEKLVEVAKEEKAKGKEQRLIFLELGPSRSLTSLAKRNLPKNTIADNFSAIALGRHPKDSSTDAEVFLRAIGDLWKGGVDIDFGKFFHPSGGFLPPLSRAPRRIVLPTYVFDRDRCWAAEKPSDASAEGLTYRVEWEQLKDLIPQATESKIKSSTELDWVIVPATRADFLALKSMGISNLLLAKTPSTFTLKWASEAFQRGHVAFVALSAAHVESFKSETQIKKGKITRDAWEIARRMLSLLQALAIAAENTTTSSRVHLALVTGRGRPELGSAWGLAKVSALEFNHEMDITRLLWTSGSLPAALKASVALVKQPKGPLEAMLDPTGCLSVRKLRRVTTAPKGIANGLLRTDGVWIITGGTRGIGLRVAVWLVQTFKIKHVALLSRRPPEHLPTEAAFALKAAGAQAYLEATDVTDTKSVEAAVSRIRSRGRPVRGIVHSAGILDDGVIVNLTPERLERVIKVKTAAWEVCQAVAESTSKASTKDSNAPPELDAVLLFSSTSSLFGVAGQGSYVAGNAFLDWLADLRSQNACPTLAIQWGAWGEIGMSVDTGLKEDPGERHLSPTAALDALTNTLIDALGNASTGVCERSKHTHLGAGIAGYAIVDIRDWSAYSKNDRIFGDRGRDLVLELAGNEAEARDTGERSEGRVKGEGSVEEFIAGRLKSTDLSISLGDAGLDSLDIINLRNSLKSRFCASLPLDRFFDRSLSVTTLIAELEAARTVA
ncbi:hypothetical protein AAMO2058_000185600 [Amorphochlora amoebiformis]